MRTALSNPRDELAKLVYRDMLNSLLENDGEGFRLLMQEAKKSKNKRFKRDAERLAKNPLFKHLTSH
jgi:hypothetical protein